MPDRRSREAPCSTILSALYAPIAGFLSEAARDDTCRRGDGPTRGYQSLHTRLARVGQRGGGGGAPCAGRALVTGGDEGGEEAGAGLVVLVERFGVILHGEAEGVVAQLHR